MRVVDNDKDRIFSAARVGNRRHREVGLAAAQHQLTGPAAIGQSALDLPHQLRLTEPGFAENERPDTEAQPRDNRVALSRAADDRPGLRHRSTFVSHHLAFSSVSK